MDDLCFVNESITIDKLLHVSASFCFSEFFLNFLAQITITKFRDDVGIIFGSIDFVQSKNIGVFLHSFQDLYLRRQQGAINL